MRIVITGATSFLGQGLLKTLLNYNHDCYAIVRPESLSKLEHFAPHPNLHLVAKDVTDIHGWKEQVGETDLFYHFAWGGVGSVGRADSAIQEKNVQTALACMNAASEMNCKRFLFAGSQAEYGLTNDFVDELHLCQPVIEYGKAKLKVKKLCTELSRTLNIEYVHCRIFSVYGTGDHPWTLVSQCIDSFSKNQTIDLSSCEQMWNFLYVDDAVYMMYLLGLCELYEKDPVYNIASRDTRPLKEFVYDIWSACGCRGTANFGGRKGAIEKAYGINPCADKLFKTIHWTPNVSFKRGIMEIIREKENGI